jgi:hypothetical protein
MSNPNNMNTNLETTIMAEIKVIQPRHKKKKLFNFENKNYDSQDILINDTTLIGIENHEIVVCNPTSKYSKSFYPLLEIVKIKNKYVIKKNSSNYNLKKPIYIVVRSLKKQDGINARGMALSVGSIFKIGKLKFKIIETKLWNRNKTKLEVEASQTIKKDEEVRFSKKKIDVTQQVEELQLFKKENPDKEITCRYCFLDSIADDKFDDLLIIPCKCDGGSKYVHLICLKNWIQSKIVGTNSNNVAKYCWDEVKCEVCKQEWPMVVVYKDQYRQLITIEKPDYPYIIAENFNPHSDEKSVLSLILGNEDQKIKVGRGNICDFKLVEDSISRTHAFIEFEDNQFVIKDNLSKFGTFVRLEEDYSIQYEQVGIQVENILFLIKLRDVSLSEIDQDDVSLFK